VIDVTVGGRQAKCLVDTGANSCFVSRLVCAAPPLLYTESRHSSATLADKSTTSILGKTTPLVVSCTAQGINVTSDPTVFQVLESLDGVDAVIGMNLLLQRLA
jgi:hypothetical protein